MKKNSLYLVTSPSEHVDNVILLPVIDSLKQKQSGDLAKGGFLPWSYRLSYKFVLECRDLDIFTNNATIYGIGNVFHAHPQWVF